MVVFEKVFSNDKRDAPCSPCRYPCSCVTVLCFHEQAEARYLVLLGLFHFIQYTLCQLIYICSPTLSTTVEKGKGDEGCSYSQLYTAHFSSSRLYTVSDTVYYNFCLASKKSLYTILLYICSLCFTIIPVA